MILTAVAFSDIILAVHILAVVVGFGVVLAYPLFAAVGPRLDPRAMPWFHRMQHVLGQRLISPGLVVILIAGIYLASHEHQWHAFYVQWGLAAVVLLGGISGGFLGPRESKLAELAERDVGAAVGEEVRWSPEYEALTKQVRAVTWLMILLVVVTVLLMSARVGA